MILLDSSTKNHIKGCILNTIVHSTFCFSTFNMSNSISKNKKRKNEAISENESCSSDEFEDENSSSESEVEVEKTSQKRKKKETSTKSKPKKIQKVEDEKVYKSKKKSAKCSTDTFDDNICKDISVEHMKCQRVRLASNLIIEKKVIEVNEPGKKKFKFPALVFARKGADGKVFEFNLHTSFIPKIQEALEYFQLKQERKM